ncbi:MAG: DUF4870 domain-containing protein [Selenomonas sp.]|uniref:DUF4870 domain-containing protein n=1 Tax=Selenomonas sp. TaxID=2053611 RepID=UPI0025CFD78C|nr:DUF4870 domain-containing protein [Selenomonas sp.]MCI6085313.1 DUF4870 domain-containing protein [Selenomonas sp.]
MENITWPQRIAATAAHASWIFGVGVIWLPLLLWLVFRNNDFVRPHAKQALAWQICSLVFLFMVGVGTVLAGLADNDDDLMIAAAILCVAIIPATIFPFIGTIKALAMEPYGYPLVKRFVEVSACDS